MAKISEKTMDFNSKVKTNFEGGDLTSDSGLLLYKEFDEKIGFSETIRECLDFNDDVEHRIHDNADVVIQRIFQNAAGYHADRAANHLRKDTLFTTVLGKEQLASQPTMSRQNSISDKETMKQMQNAKFKLIKKIYRKENPEDIFLDLDSSASITYGDQYGSNYNKHYGHKCYHPLLLFDGKTGDALKGELRAGNVYTSRQVVRFIGPVLKDYGKTFPETSLYLRADSGFAIPGLYRMCEEHNTSYAIRLKANAKLYELAEPLVEKLCEPDSNKFKDSGVVYGEFNYQAGSWEDPRRVVVKIEKSKYEIALRYTFIVTNILDKEPKELIDFYFKRSTMENFIKEAKNGFAIDRMSSTDFWSNACKLQQMLLAYNLNNWLRRITFPEGHKSDRIFTIRMKLIKIAARVVRTGRYLYFKLASSCPYKKLFLSVLDNIQNLEFT